MTICHAHNLAHAIATDLHFGIRVKLRNTDPFRNLIGSDWSKEHWYAAAAERDQALTDMSSRYLYFRASDAPSLVFEKISK